MGWNGWTRKPPGETQFWRLSSSLKWGGKDVWGRCIWTAKHLFVSFSPFFWDWFSMGPLLIWERRGALSGWTLSSPRDRVSWERKYHFWVQNSPSYFLASRQQGILGPWHTLWVSDIQGQCSVSFLFLFPLSNFIWIIKNTADHTERLLAERQSVPEGPAVGHRVYDVHKTRARSERGLLSDRASASTRVPRRLTALDICWGLGLFFVFFCSVLFPGACASVHVCTHLKIERKQVCNALCLLERLKP